MTTDECVSQKYLAPSYQLRKYLARQIVIDLYYHQSRRNDDYQVKSFNNVTFHFDRTQSRSLFSQVQRGILFVRFVESKVSWETLASFKSDRRRNAEKLNGRRRTITFSKRTFANSSEFNSVVAQRIAGTIAKWISFAYTFPEITFLVRYFYVYLVNESLAKRKKKNN